MHRLIYVFMLITTPLIAQNSASNTSLPQIIVSSKGEVKINPDRATIHISVQTKAPTAAAAASDNASKQKAVINALRSLGLKETDISTSDYSVYPEQRYEPNREPIVVGYSVTNTLSIDVTTLKMVGPVIDAALAKGANTVTSLQFRASNTDEARRAAIALAVQSARADAEAAAKAAGGSLGVLLELTIGAYFPPPPRPFDIKVRTAMSASADQTPISAGEQTVSVDLTTRWAYLSPNR